jgi:hypothetical protein
MGTLGRRIENFGHEMSDRVGDLRSNVGDRLGDIRHRVGDLSKEEGALTETIEKFTAALPSTTWLALAGVSMLGSLGLTVFGKHKAATFVGQFTSAFLLIGVYNKLVKIHGSDRFKS